MEHRWESSDEKATIRKLLNKSLNSYGLDNFGRYAHSKCNNKSFWTQKTFLAYGTVENPHLTL